MTPEQAFQFLGAGVRTGHLATVRADGRPHAKPIWFVTDGTPAGFVLYFNTWHSSVAGRNLRRDPRVTISVDDSTPPFSYVIVEGTAELLTFDEATSEFRDRSTAIAARYMGDELAGSYGARNAVAGEFLVRITPSRVLGETGVAD
ncbi:PPOX class F420-dependent oxidoreductase [Kineosporia succinea]